MARDAPAQGEAAADGSGPSAPGKGAGAGLDSYGQLAYLVRIVAHLAAEVPIGIVVGLQIAHGWLPTSDDAVIAWRSWNVFSRQLPLDGQFTQITAAGGHPAFDLGPLQYLLVAIPDRLDPVHGVLWGSALVAIVLVAVAIEAGRAFAGTLGVVLTALGSAAMTATLIPSTVNLAWNPSMGVYALGTTTVTCLAVANGRFRWFPIAVFAASLAAQCHTSFALTAVAVLVASTILGLTTRPDPPQIGRYLFAGVILGAALFALPLAQEITGHPGNWTVLFSSIGRHGPDVGFRLGLRGLGATTRVLPPWAVREPVRDYFDASATYGAIALGLCAVITLGAALTRRRRLLALATVALAAGLTAAWTVGSVPRSQSLYLLDYLYFVLCPTGMLIVATFATAIIVTATALSRTARALAGGGPGPARHSRRRSRRALLVTTALGLACGGALFGELDLPLASSIEFLSGPVPIQLAAKAAPKALAVATDHGYGPHSREATAVRVVVTRDSQLVVLAVEQAVAYLLVTEGIPARVGALAGEPLGPDERGGKGLPEIVVEVTHRGGHLGTAVSWRPAGSF